jgi:hypothetical protein
MGERQKVLEAARRAADDAEQGHADSGSRDSYDVPVECEDAPESRRCPTQRRVAIKSAR